MIYTLQKLCSYRPSLKLGGSKNRLSFDSVPHESTDRRRCLLGEGVAGSSIRLGFRHFLKSQDFFTRKFNGQHGIQNHCDCF